MHAQERSHEPMNERLQKIIARAGIASRRKSEDLIRDGRVSINGKIITQMGQLADPDEDRICVDGKEIRPFGSQVYVILHKPRGYITSTRDERDRPVVTDLITGVQEPIVPVGRLDWDTTGLLILTNDGDLTQALTHPKHQIEKTYIVRLEGPLEGPQMARLTKGVELDGHRCRAHRLKPLKTPKGHEHWYEISIREGRNRQVRRMFEAVDHRVRKLKRIRVGEILLGELEPGQWRKAADWEIRYFTKLKRQNHPTKGETRS